MTSSSTTADCGAVLGGRRRPPVSLQNKHPVLLQTVLAFFPQGFQSKGEQNTLSNLFGVKAHAV